MAIRTVAIRTMAIRTMALLVLTMALLAKVSAVYSTLSRRNAKAQTDALALSADVAEQVGIALALTKPTSTPHGHGSRSG
jgi:hypothetical protein